MFKTNAQPGAAGFLRPALRRVEPVAHGSVPADELAPFGLRPDEVVDFSVSTNPLGPAPSVLQALHDAAWTRYPGDDEAPLRRKLADRNGVEPVQVALGNGSAELMWLVALAVLRPGDTVGIVGPTFGEYARAARVMGATTVEVRDPAEAPKARLLFLCQPNNPTGLYRDRDAVARALETCPDRLLVLDEAYLPLMERDATWPSPPLLADHPNLVILRSMTKDQALPGLRLGYVLAAPEIARALEMVRPPWSVNAGALAAGLAALEPEAEAHAERARQVIAASRGLLVEGFTRLGYRVWPTLANFVLVEVENGAAFRRALLPRGLVVRDCASFGLPSCVRVACRLPEECLRLLTTVEEVVPRAH